MWPCFYPRRICGLVLSTVASVHHGFCPPWPCDFEWCMQVSFKWHNRDIIDNRDYMDTIIVMLENPQSLSPSVYSLLSHIVQYATKSWGGAWEWGYVWSVHLLEGLSVSCWREWIILLMVHYTHCTWMKVSPSLLHVQRCLDSEFSRNIELWTLLGMCTCTCNVCALSSPSPLSWSELWACV